MSETESVDQISHDLIATDQELACRRTILDRLRLAIESNVRIDLPSPEPLKGKPSEQALLGLLHFDSTYGGGVSRFRYLFEGEEDLLHLIVVRSDGTPIAVEEAHLVTKFLLGGLSPGLIWLKPGHLSHHFYVGHDDLLEVLEKLA